MHGNSAKKGEERERGRRMAGYSEREVAIRERDLAEEETARLRQVVQRKRKELKARMSEVVREETERRRALDERSTGRHKQVMLEAYEQQCDEAAKIFAEYQKRLHHYVNQARGVQRSTASTAYDSHENINTKLGKESVYSTVKGNESSDDVIVIETTRERHIRKACENLTTYMINKIRNTFPAYEGIGVHLDPHSDADKLFELDGEVPDDVKAVAIDALKNPSLLLQNVSTYNSRVTSMIHNETEKIDIKADAELLRFKYENSRVTDGSPDTRSPLQYQIYSDGKGGSDLSIKGTSNQLLERQKAHVQQFLATEDSLNKASDAQNLCIKLIKRLEGSLDLVTTQKIPGGMSQSIGNIRHSELEVWAKEREAAGLRASLNTLTSNVERLKKLCVEWKEAEDSLRKKWKKIEEFDGRRSELEIIYNSLIHANMGASTFWSQQPLVAREETSKTIDLACTSVTDISNHANDLIEKEVSAFYKSLDNSLYMLPSTPQALLEYMGSNDSTGSESIASAEKNADLLTSRAGAGDPSAIPSVCRISAALQYSTGTGSLNSGLASVLESLDFCLKLRGSEASILEELSKAINLVNIRRNLVENNRVLLKHARRVQHGYDRTVNFCLKLAADQEKVVMERWLPELRNAVSNAQNCFVDCERVRGLVDEWWEQPAAMAVDWVTVDGQNVATWLSHVKQVQMALYDQEHL